MALVKEVSAMAFLHSRCILDVEQMLFWRMKRNQDNQRQSYGWLPWNTQWAFFGRKAGESPHPTALGLAPRLTLKQGTPISKQASITL